jgi:hypothetical protein
MSQFFESICINDGVAENLHFHQARMHTTLNAFNASQYSIELKTIIEELVLPALGLFKIKISYDLNGNHQAEWNPYQYK